MATRRWAVGALMSVAIVAAGVTVAPMAATAKDSTFPVYVASGPLGSGRSCSSPNFNTVQSALNAVPAGSTIHVCSGTYVQQLTITQPVTIIGVGGPVIQLPASPVNTRTACDTAPGTGSYQPDQDGVSICTSGTVSISGVTFSDLWPSGTCNDSLYGLLVAGGATLDLTNSTEDGAGASPINGCQGGVGIQVGMAWTTPVEVGHAVLDDVTVDSYQKNGITIDGTGSSATVDDATVTGAGQTDQTAQNGIQVSNGATATIDDSVISQNECDVASCGPDSMVDYQAAGVLLYGAGTTTVEGCTINDNDMGVYSYAGGSTAPSTPNTVVKSSSFNDDRYESALLDQGDASLSKDTFDGGTVAVQMLQYAGQSFGAVATVTKAHVYNMSYAAVQVYSDQSASDVAGSITVSKSRISNNPLGATVAGSVQNNSSAFTVTLTGDS